LVKEILFIPPNPETLAEDYEGEKIYFEELLLEVNYIMNKRIKEEGIKILGIEYRVKTFDSFYNKIKEDQIEGNAFNIMNDIAGLRVICYYRTDLNRIENIIKDKFQILKTKHYNDDDASIFGYKSNKYVINLLDEYTGERYDDIKGIKCEIQVRTISMHLWAVISHDLDYKQELDIPTVIKDDFKALSGFFQLADSNFDKFREARVNALQGLKERSDKVFNMDEDFNLDSLETYLKCKFPERAHASSGSISALLGSLNDRKLNDYHRINNFIDTNYENARKFEINMMKENEQDTDYTMYYITTKKGDIVYLDDTGIVFTMISDVFD